MRLFDDARHAIRFVAKMFRTEFGSTLVTVLTLAIAIGANTTVFGVANALLFKRSPGVSKPEQLVNIGRNARFDSISYPSFLDYKDRNHVFTGVAAYTIGDTALGLRHGDEAQQVSALIVSENFFEVLGTTPAIGRFFGAADSEPGAASGVVISYGLWLTQFNGGRSVPGKEIILNGHPVSVIGVAAEAFHGSDLRQTDVWLPIALRGIARPGIAPIDRLQSRFTMWLVGIARLKPGISMERAQVDLNVISAQLQQAYPEAKQNIGASVVPYASIPGQQRTIQLFFTALMSIVGLILLIACANVAGIEVARAVARKREVALRLALGASRARIMRQLLTETLALFAIAGAGGILVASWITDLLYGLKGDIPFPVAIDLSPDSRVVLFTVGITFAAALISGLMPALSAGQTELAAALKEESMMATARQSRLRRALVVTQVSLSLVLLITGGLFVRTLRQADLTKPGFDPGSVEVIGLDFEMAGYDEAQGRRFAENLVTRVSALPGVESASLAHDLPLDLSAFSIGNVNVEGRQAPNSAPMIRADWNVVSPGFFRTIRLPLLRGRDFTAADREGSAEVAIINQTMSDRFWPGQDPVGKRFHAGAMRPGATGNDTVLEVIGVAKDTQNRTVGDQPIPFVYVPINQTYNGSQSLLVRTSRGAIVIPAVRQVLREIDPNLPIVNVRSLDQVIALGLLPQRVAAWIVGVMGLVGVLLASIGIYGVTTHAVTSRTREIGIRIALGAKPNAVLRLILHEGFVVSAIGLVLGLAGGVAVGQFIRSYLYGVAPTDLIAFGVATLALAAVALLAGYLPARRATAVDPMVALRHE